MSPLRVGDTGITNACVPIPAFTRFWRTQIWIIRLVWQVLFPTEPFPQPPVFLFWSDIFYLISVYLTKTDSQSLDTVTVYLELLSLFSFPLTFYLHLHTLHRVFYTLFGKMVSSKLCSDQSFSLEMIHCLDSDSWKVKEYPKQKELRCEHLNTFNIYLKTNKSKWDIRSTCLDIPNSNFCFKLILL